MFKPFFGGPYLPFNAFFEPEDDGATSVHNVDVVFLPTAARTLPIFLDDSYIEKFPRLKDLKIHAIVHRPSRWHWRNWTLVDGIPERLATAISQERLSFMTLAPHVTRTLEESFQLPHFANLTFSPPNISHFIPVIPNVLRQDELPLTASDACNRAVLQGANRADDFLRVQEGLLQEIRGELVFILEKP